MGAVVLRKGGAHVNQYGRFPHDEMIGKPYGTKLFPKGRGKGYLLLLRATPGGDRSSHTFFLAPRPNPSQH